MSRSLPFKKRDLRCCVYESVGTLLIRSRANDVRSLRCAQKSPASSPANLQREPLLQDGASFLLTGDTELLQQRDQRVNFKRL